MSLLKLLFNKIFPVVLTFWEFLIRLVRPFRLKRMREGSSVVIHPPAPFGSFGDEAMMHSVIPQLHKQGIKYIGMVSINNGPLWEEIPLVTENITLSNIYYMPLRLIKFAWIVGRYHKFYLLGADMMDGCYSQSSSATKFILADIAARVGTKAEILGFSFNDKPGEIVVDALKNLHPSVRLCARDPISRERLHRHSSRNIDQVADLAFLLQPEAGPNTKIVQEWVSANREKGRGVIGINANYASYRRLQGGSESDRLQKVIELHCSLIERLSKEINPTSFLLIPHDIRKDNLGNSDVTIAESVYNTLKKDSMVDVMVFPSSCNVSEIKYIVGLLDIVVTGRMHLAIAALGQGIPAVCMGYQDKFEGLMNFFNLKEVVIDTQTAFSGDNYYSFVLSAIRRKEEYQLQIQNYLPSVKTLSLRNIIS